MNEGFPPVVHRGTFPLDLTDPLKRFKHARFNYFYKDPEAKLLIGLWEVEDGSEIIGEMIGGGTSDEIMVVLEGELHASAPGMPEQVARPGDLVAAMRYRQTRVEVKGHARVCFIVNGIDPEEAETLMRGGER